MSSQDKKKLQNLTFSSKTIVKEKSPGAQAELKRQINESTNPSGRPPLVLKAKPSDLPPPVNTGTSNRNNTKK